MSAPPGINEGQSTTRPPLFNRKYYSWWKTRMEDFLTAEDYELCTIVNRGPLTPTKKMKQNETAPKDPSEFVASDFRMMEKNAKAKKILICGLGPDEYNRIFACSNAKEIWDALQTAHKGTNQLGRFISEELVSNVLRILLASWESKVIAIQEAKEMDKISQDELIGNLKTHEMRKLELCKEELERDKALFLVYLKKINMAMMNST
ncbi:PREDICTED: uncharacterized protein LOC109212577 [Nicotiana attenuata]|uniref:uncharacterized protein LOC109212577 n=1 Tax=Nicotiana attenuata TaxID=49451 RepID=UPI000904DB6D|nr:PREDICTED: uncharacterized protein LOC109212577 [Nicotiana attenuata]